MSLWFLSFENVEEADNSYLKRSCFILEIDFTSICISIYFPRRNNDIDSISIDLDSWSHLMASNCPNTSLSTGLPSSSAHWNKATTTAGTIFFCLYIQFPRIIPLGVEWSRPLSLILDIWTSSEDSKPTKWYGTTPLDSESGLIMYWNALMI